MRFSLICKLKNYSYLKDAIKVNSSRTVAVIITVTRVAFDSLIICLWSFCRFPCTKRKNNHKMLKIQNINISNVKLYLSHHNIKTIQVSTFTSTDQRYIICLYIIHEYILKCAITKKNHRREKKRKRQVSEHETPKNQ